MELDEVLIGKGLGYDGILRFDIRKLWLLGNGRGEVIVLSDGFLLAVESLGFLDAGVVSLKNIWVNKLSELDVDSVAFEHSELRSGSSLCQSVTLDDTA